MTRLTLDTIALCAFDYRFNSFYQNEMHPFVAAMVDALDEAGQRGRRPNMLSNLMVVTKRKYEADQVVLAKVADQLIAERRQDPRGLEKHDLLNVMLNGVDTVSGEKLSDENIRFQLVTFLIAGHETTSGLLSFAVYLLLKNPAVLLKAQADRRRRARRRDAARRASRAAALPRAGADGVAATVADRARVRGQAGRGHDARPAATR